jgi:hypothetical protein
MIKANGKDRKSRKLVRLRQDDSGGYREAV